MRVLNYSPGADTGGQGIRLKWAFDKHSEIDYSAWRRSNNYISYPVDLPKHALKQAIAKADVIHTNNTFRGLQGVKKPMVIHYHGSLFRRSPGNLIRQQKARKAAGTVSTLDLWLLAPDDTEWLPAPYDLDWLQSFRKPSESLRVGHAPTDRKVKSTDAFLKACEEVPEIEPVLIERQTWQKTLERKGTVDVFYDQAILGYGNNAIEAWGMGIPVICGAQPDTLAEMRNRFEIPFYLTTPDSIADALRAMTDPDVRAEYAKKGRVHAERFHADKVVVAQLEKLYGRVS